MLAHKITVKQVSENDSELNLLGADGIYSHYKKLIKIKKDTDLVSESYREATFYHELIHCLFEHAQRDDLSKDEALVDLMADLLYQYLKTVKF